MLLAIDIGNTNINLGVFQGNRLVKRYCFATKGTNYRSWLKKVCKGNKIKQAVICSVVPLAAKLIEKELVKLLGKRPYNIGKDIIVPIKNLYRKPRQVGQDRLVNAYAAVMLYGAPLIIVDFGTAITFDVISKDKGYLGGMILPGLRISLEALKRCTALLPEVELAKPKEFIGRDTRNSMLSGVVYGFAALTDSLTARIKEKLGHKVKVIGTGGNIRLLKQYCRCFSRVDPDLTLRGINFLAKKS
ncbi:MAG: type III pantothenate kinase [Candidatus Omnitrophota bacterium]